MIQIGGSSPSIATGITASRRVFLQALPLPAEPNWLFGQALQVSACLLGELGLGTSRLGSTPMAKQPGGCGLSRSNGPS